MRGIFLRGIGAILCLAAVPKLRHPLLFYAALRGYQLFPEDWVPRLTFFVPALEMVVGLSMLLWVSRAGHLWSVFLFAGFTGALSWARLHHLSLTCGCFGRFDSNMHRLPHGLALHIVITAATTVALVYLWLRPQPAPPETRDNSKIAKP
jgi:hypothetical protein